MFASVPSGQQVAVLHTDFSPRGTRASQMTVEQTQVQCDILSRGIKQ